MAQLLLTLVIKNPNEEFTRYMGSGKMKLPKLYTIFRPDIQLIEKELRSAIQVDAKQLQEASVHTLKAGGKRIRPVFVLLTAKFGHYDISQIKYAAVALELIHSASLVHDDIIDEAELRRGSLTVRSKWDNKVATYTGDYIFARAQELMTYIEEPLAHKVLAKTIMEVSIGEIEQIKDKYNFNQNLRNYLRRIKRKTAYLIAASCQLGAISAGVSEEIHKKLFLYGYYVGMSFQIMDDVLDFTATEKELGKPAGSDLWQGNITLPVLYAMENPSINKVIRTVHEDMSHDELKPILQEIKSSGAIEKSIFLSNTYLDKALNILNELPDSKNKQYLIDIARFIGKRKY